MREIRVCDVCHQPLGPEAHGLRKRHAGGCDAEYARRYMQVYRGPRDVTKPRGWNTRTPAFRAAKVQIRLRPRVLTR